MNRWRRWRYYRAQRHYETLQHNLSVAALWQTQEYNPSRAG